MKQKLPTIQIFRGIAAMLVILYHINFTISDYFHIQSFHIFANFGYLGVDFFFVLSGFIITYIHLNDIINKGDWKVFAKKRFARIYPFFWLLLTIILVYEITLHGNLMAAKKFDPHAISDWAFIGNQYLLLPNSQYIIGPSWSLTFELLFYVVFTICIILGKRTTLYIISIWLILIVVGVFFKPNNVLLSTYIFEFLLGCVIGYLFTKGHLLTFKIFLPAANFILLVGVVYFHFFSFVKNGLFEKLFVASICALFIWLGATIDQKEKFTAFKLSFLVLIGNASYAIYLSHEIILSVTLRLVKKFNFGHLLLNLSFLSVFIFTILFGIALHLVVEKRVIKFTNRVLKLRHA